MPISLVIETFLVGELWPQTEFGRDTTLLSVELENELVTRLKDQVHMLRKLSVYVFPKYVVYPKYVIKTFEGEVSHPFLRRNMF